MKSRNEIDGPGGLRQPLTAQDFDAAATLLQCEVAAIKAVCEVEAPSGGFNPDGSPVTLFEGHWFHRFTSGRYDALFPTISYPKWMSRFYGKTWQQERDRLDLAVSLNLQAAYLSASWGRFQIMGFNHALVGFSSVQAFVMAMRTGESEHLKAFCSYVQHECLDDDLREHRWDDFARRYNGPLYQKNRYAEKLAAACAKFSIEQERVV